VSRPPDEVCLRASPVTSGGSHENKFCRNGADELNRAMWAAASLLATVLAIGGCQQKQDANARFQALYSAEWKWREEQLADGEDSQKPISSHLPKSIPLRSRSG